MTWLTKAVRWAIVPVILALFISTLIIQIVDRFAYEGMANTFYVTKADLTCMTTTVHGKPVIWCVDGDTTGQLEIKP